MKRVQGGLPQEYSVAELGGNSTRAIKELTYQPNTPINRAALQG